MVEEKKEDIAFEIFGKRVEELKEMTENLGKENKNNPEKNNETENSKNPGAPDRQEYREEKIKNKKDGKEEQSPNPKKILKKLQVPEPPKTSLKGTNFLKDLKEKINNFNTPKIKRDEVKRPEQKPKKEELRAKVERDKNKTERIKHPIIKNFFGIHAGNKQKEIIKERVIIQRIPSNEKQEIFANLKQLSEKIDRNKEEMYTRLIRESAESKRMIEEEREQIKQQMIELLADSIDKLDNKDREIKGELYEELQKIKNKFYGEKKEIRTLFMKGSEESRKILESEREKMKEEFLSKITNLRNKINAEEKRTRELNNRNIDEPNEGKLFSLFSRFKRLPPEKEIKPDFSIEDGRYSKENLEEGDIITGMPDIPKTVDLGLPKFYPEERFVDEPKNELPEIKPFSKIEEEAIDNESYESRQFTKKIEIPGNYEKSIKNIIVPEKVSKFDLEFEKKMKDAVEKGMKDAEKKSKLEKKNMDSGIIKTSQAIPKKSVYVGELDFANAQSEIEQARKTFHTFERVVGETLENSKKEHEKISRILEDAEYVKTNFSKINSNVLGQVKV